jgi:hypothetical protein
MTESKALAVMGNEAYIYRAIIYRHPPLKGGETEAPIPAGSKYFGQRITSPSPLAGEG